MRLEIEQTGNGANDDAVTIRVVLDGPPARVIAAREFRPGPNWCARWFTDDTLHICTDDELLDELARYITETAAHRRAGLTPEQNG